jgi:hypothetical protein
MGITQHEVPEYPIRTETPPVINPLTLNDRLPWYQASSNENVYPDPMELSAAPEHGRDTDDRIIYSEIWIFPFRVRNHRTNPIEGPPTIKVIRPYKEILDLIKMNHQVLLTQNQEREEGEQWDHVTHPIVYINTLGSVFGIAKFLLLFYSVIADLDIVYSNILPISLIPPPPYL